MQQTHIIRHLLGTLLTLGAVLMSAPLAAGSAQERYPSDVGVMERTADGAWRLVRATQKISYAEARKVYFGVTIYLPEGRSFKCRIKTSFPGNLSGLTVSDEPGVGKKGSSFPPGTYEKDGIVYLDLKMDGCSHQFGLHGNLDSNEDLPGRRAYKIYVDGRLVLDTYIDIVK